MLKIIAIALLIVPAVSATGQDLEKGLGAHLSGDYATAVRELTPFAEQGKADAQHCLTSSPMEQISGIT